MKPRQSFLSFILSLILAGCVSLPAARRTELLPIPNFYANNTVYYPLKSLCAYFNIDWDYDSLGRQITLKKSDTETRLLIDSSMVLVNNSALDMGQPVVVKNGNVSVPLRFKEMIIDKFYKEIAPLPVPKIAIPAIRRVVVDAGHGGHDPGAIGRTGLREKDVNLDIARRLVKLLEAQAIEVIMTRSSDRFISLEGRAAITNKAQADLFVSIHSNSARSSKLSGFEVYYITDKINDSSRALAAAENNEFNIDGSFYGNSLDLKAALWDMLYTDGRGRSISLAQNICQSAGQDMGLKILGVKGARFYVLKGSNIPAVLVEVGFVSNPLEERYLRNGFYRQQIAEVISQGILNYARRQQDNLAAVVLP